jgi:hypothetical protein
MNLAEEDMLEKIDLEQLVFVPFTVRQDLESKGISLSLKIKNAFNKKIEGWPLVQDAFNDLDNKSVFYNNLESSKWCRDTSWDEDSFKVNSHGFRSEEFTNTHKQKHILFSGCSVTYGLGLYANETWSYKLYENIIKNEEVSGYFNIAKPGASIMEIVSGIFKYMAAYGKPDTIFINLPDAYRKYVVVDSEGSDNTKGIDVNKIITGVHQAIYNLSSTENKKELFVYAYQYLMMLEEHCKSLGIDLYIFSYSQELNDLLKSWDIESVIFVERKAMNSAVWNNTKGNSLNYSLTARDARHFGWAFHDVWSDIMFNEYKNRQEK